MNVLAPQSIEFTSILLLFISNHSYYIIFQLFCLMQLSPITHEWVKWEASGLYCEESNDRQQTEQFLKRNFFGWLTSFGTPTAPTRFAILLGAARYVNDYVGLKRGPNAQWRINYQLGPNPGALELVCQTRTGCGIASRHTSIKFTKRSCVLMFCAFQFKQLYVFYFGYLQVRDRHCLWGPV